MTPGSLAIVSGIILAIGILTVIINFCTVFKREGDIKTSNFVLHLVGAVMSSGGTAGLIFSGLWFLAHQVGKG